MRIKKSSIKNLRSIREIEIDFESVTSLIGGNNVGKSTILRAFELFFDSAPRITIEDTYQRNAEDIEIIIEFSDLTPAEIEKFDYEALANDFGKPIRIRALDIGTYPLFGFVFAQTDPDNQKELHDILNSDLREYILVRQ